MHNSTIYTILNLDEGAGILQAKVALNELPEIGGMKNIGVMSGILYQHRDSMINFIKSVIEPNGYLAPHAAPNAVCIFILQGSGEMTNVDGEDKVINKVFFKAGDVLIFDVPMPLHSYQAGPEGAEYLVVSLLQESGKDGIDQSA